MTIWDDIVAFFTGRQPSPAAERRLTVADLGELETELLRLMPNEQAYINANDYVKITDEDLDEGRRKLTRIAARCRCELTSTADRVYFTKKPN